MFLYIYDVKIWIDKDIKKDEKIFENDLYYLENNILKEVYRREKIINDFLKRFFIDIYNCSRIEVIDIILDYYKIKYEIVYKLINEKDNIYVIDYKGETIFEYKSYQRTRDSGNCLVLNDKLNDNLYRFYLYIKRMIEKIEEIQRINNCF